MMIGEEALPSATPAGVSICHLFLRKRRNEVLEKKPERRFSLSSSGPARRGNTEKGQPRHSSIRPKKIGGFGSGRIGLRYRALAKERADGLDLLVDHLRSKPVDRHMDPVMLFAFDDEACKSVSIRRIPPTLSDHVDQQSPSSCLCSVAKSTCYRFLLLLSTANRSTDGLYKPRYIPPTNGWLGGSRVRNQGSSGGRSAGGNTWRCWRLVWQSSLQKRSNDPLISSVDVHRHGAQRVWKVISSGVISCVVRKEIQESSVAATGCIEIQR